MAGITIQRAVKYQAKLRLSLAGPAGSGKTFSALTLATALCDLEANGKRVALIDTERSSASKYADIFDFDMIELPNFSPLTYIEAIQLVERERGYSILIIDSLSHAWKGVGGLLEMVDGIARRKYNNNTFSAWKDGDLIQNQFIDAITSSSLHLIATMRTKMDYVQEKNQQTGRTEIRKVGLAPVQRDGMEYEFDIAADLENDNTMVVQKSRCSALSGKIIPKPGKEVAKTLHEWLQGEPAPPPPMTVKEVYEAALAAKICQDREGFYSYAAKLLNQTVGKDTVMQLTQKQLQQILNAGKGDTHE